MKYSRFIPRSIAALVKSRNQISFFRTKIKAIKQDPDKYVYLIGTPIHANMGDHLIAMAEKEYLLTTLQNEVMDIPTEMFQIYRHILRRTIPSSSYVFITGGGWMGDVWPIEERTIESIALTFKTNPILIFPQTVYYQNPNEDNKVSRMAQQAFQKCKKLVLCVRDKGSYDYCVAHYNNKTILCPDIGLYYKIKLGEKRNKRKIGICFREDREKINHLSENEIIEGFKGESIEFVKLSTLNEHPVSCEERHFEVNRLIEQFHDCSIIITDRLHGMIYSYIAETPCIAFDNKTHKVSGVYELWLKGSSSVFVVNENITGDQLAEIGKKMLVEPFCKTDNCNTFQEIDEVINKWKR